MTHNNIRGAAPWDKLPSDMIREVVECKSVNLLLRILKDYSYIIYFVQIVTY